MQRSAERRITLLPAAAMVGIGLRFAAQGAVNPNIEDTLLFAANEALEQDDLRVLGVAGDRLHETKVSLKFIVQSPSPKLAQN